VRFYMGIQLFTRSEIPTQTYLSNFFFGTALVQVELSESLHSFYNAKFHMDNFPRKEKLHISLQLFIWSEISIQTYLSSFLVIESPLPPIKGSATHILYKVYFAKRNSAFTSYSSTLTRVIFLKLFSLITF